MTIYRGQGGLGDSYNDPELVHTSGDETIEGVKTFTSTIIGTVSGHYTKAEEDAKLALKANQSTTYTKTEVDTALSGKLSNADGSVTTSKIEAGAVTPDKLSSTAQYTGFKNRIINGVMVIDQRNAGASVTPTDGTYTLDRWVCGLSQASKFTVQQTPSATETGYATRVAAGFSNYLACTVGASANVTLGAGDVFAISQKIEGFNFADMAWGTSNAKTVTLSFLAYSSVTGTFGGAMVNSANNRSYPFTYSIPTANTWTTISITIAGDTSGTWVGATNGIGAKIWFSLGAGSSGSNTAGAWVGANSYSATGAVSPITTNSATFYITGVQLEKGSTATSFDYRPYGTELVLCQRYYQQAMAGFAITNLSTQTDVSCTFPLKVEMRADPTAGFASIPAGMRFHRPGIAFYNVTAITGVPNKSGQEYSSVTIASGAGTETSGQLTEGPWLTAEL